MKKKKKSEAVEWYIKGEYHCDKLNTEKEKRAIAYLQAFEPASEPYYLYYGWKFCMGVSGGLT